MGVAMAFMLLMQLPNLLTNLWLRDTLPSPNPNAPPKELETALKTWHARRVAKERQIVALVDAAHRYVPFLWLPQGAKALAEQRAGPAVFGALGMFAIGALGLARAYRGTLRFYQGGETKKPARALSPARTTGRDKRILVERLLPVVPEEAAALGLASVRSMSRAPEVKMALAANVLVFALIGATMFLPRGGSQAPGILPRSSSPTSSDTAFR